MSLETYLKDKKVDDILTDMVVAVGRERPEQPAAFMVEYLSEKYLGVVPKSSTWEDRARIVDKEFEGNSDTDNKNNTNKSNNDDDNEAQAATPPPQQRGRRGAICCEPVDEDDGNNEPRKKIPKSAEAQRKLDDALKANIMFAHLDAEERAQVFDAMFQVEFESGAVVIKQGDEGDNFYVIDTGDCDIFVQKGDEEPKKVLSLSSGGSFGELALIYGSPRAATVKAASDCMLWAIDRVTYRRILMGTTMRKRKLYEGFLEKVPILQHLTKYERITVADALEGYKFTDGQVIVRQGEPGDKFYIIVSGEVRCDQMRDAKSQEVARLGAAAYFGEIALLTNRPRAATVTAVGDVKCVGLDRDRFNRVLGPCEEILRRNMDSYNLYMTAQI